MTIDVVVGDTIRWGVVVMTIDVVNVVLMVDVVVLIDAHAHVGVVHVGMIRDVAEVVHMVIVVVGTIVGTSDTCTKNTNYNNIRVYCMHAYTALIHFAYIYIIIHACYIH